jgi:hypothetical protein
LKSSVNKDENHLIKVHVLIISQANRNLFV